MYSCLVTVLLLASAAYYSKGARVPVTSYVCTQPHYPVFIDVNQCSVNSGLRTCGTKEGVHPNLLNGDDTTRNGIYVWKNNTNPFVVLDIPQGWCVGSVKMTFLRTGGIPTVSLSVHSAKHLSTNTNRTMFSISELHNRAEGGGTQVVMSLATLACGRYLRINMTSDRDLYLTEVEVFGTSASVSSAVPGLPSTPSPSPTITTSGHPVGPTTSVGSSTYLADPGATLSPSPSIPPTDVPVVQDNYVLPAAISVVAVPLVVVLIAIFVVVICIVSCKHNIRKSLKMQHLSIHYRSTQSDVTFGDSQLPVSESADVPTHATNGGVANNHNGEIKDAPHDNTALVPSTNPSAPIYGNVGPPSSSTMPAAAHPSKHCSPPKPPHSAKSPSVPQEDHIYTEVDKSHKKSISSTSSPPAKLTHSTDTTQVDGTNASADVLYDDLCGGSGNLEGNNVGQPESITSSTTDVGVAHTQAAAMPIIYTEVDYSKKKSKRGEES